MSKKSLNKTQYYSLMLMFFLMCGLRMWFAIFLFFILGISMTLINKKRTYCANYCPLGALSDAFATSEKKKFLKLPKNVSSIVFVLFFSYLFYIVYFNWGNSIVLWMETFKFTIFIVSIALVLQIYYKNRTWCTTLCPMGKVYKGIIKKF